MERFENIAPLEFREKDACRAASFCAYCKRGKKESNARSSCRRTSVDVRLYTSMLYKIARLASGPEHIVRVTWQTSEDLDNHLQWTDSICAYLRKDFSSIAVLRGAVIVCRKKNERCKVYMRARGWSRSPARASSRASRQAYCARVCAQPRRSVSYSAGNARLIERLAFVIHGLARLYVAHPACDTAQCLSEPISAMRAKHLDMPAGSASRRRTDACRPICTGCSSQRLCIPSSRKIKSSKGSSQSNHSDSYKELFYHS
ncbi:unnamed protein product [Trichogramma brassicae]|uniref:Uncharacterized protein n=1 Tax=Trichogramma brassicae TaxID=86971 RepID=A0A6H5IPV0_9HYME|nr:unnamed protein product [Trichogramma brassicae]